MSITIYFYLLDEALSNTVIHFNESLHNLLFSFYLLFVITNYTYKTIRNIRLRFLSTMFVAVDSFYKTVT